MVGEGNRRVRRPDGTSVSQAAVRPPRPSPHSIRGETCFQVLLPGVRPVSDVLARPTLAPTPSAGSPAEEHARQRGPPHPMVSYTCALDIDIALLVGHRRAPAPRQWRRASGAPRRATPRGGRRPSLRCRDISRVGRPGPKPEGRGRSDAEGTRPLHSAESKSDSWVREAPRAGLPRSVLTRYD